MSGEKTEKPTPKKLQDARKEGQIGKSQDVGVWAGMLAASILLPGVLRRTMESSVEMVEKLRSVILEPDPATALKILGSGLGDAAMAVAPLAFGMLLVGVLGSAVQGGIHPAPKLLMPKFSRLNPASGLKRMFGTQAIWELVKVLLKSAILGFVLYQGIRKMVPQMLGAGAMSLDTVVAMVTDAAMTLFRTAAVAGLILAVGDYAVVKRKTNKQLRMSKQDIKDEHKKTEGNPQIKGAIRSKQMAMSRNRMMSDVDKADVIVVNPTHVAVALQYDPAKGAPRVLAKGQGTIAAKIREKATEKRIPLIQDPPLARTLHKQCKIGQEIPPELYAAVAQVLAFVMTLKAKGSAAGMHRSPVQSGLSSG